MKTCATCKHYRETEMRDRDGSIVTIGYCHATKNYAYRAPGATCKRHFPDPKKVIG